MRALVGEYWKLSSEAEVKSLLRSRRWSRHNESMAMKGNAVGMCLELVLVGALALRAQSSSSGPSHTTPLEREYREDVQTLESVRASRNLDQLEDAIQRTSAKWRLKDRQTFLNEDALLQPTWVPMPN